MTTDGDKRRIFALTYRVCAGHDLYIRQSLDNNPILSLRGTPNRTAAVVFRLSDKQIRSNWQDTNRHGQGRIISFRNHLIVPFPSVADVIVTARGGRVRTNNNGRSGTYTEDSVTRHDATGREWLPYHNYGRCRVHTIVSIGNRD